MEKGKEDRKRFKWGIDLGGKRIEENYWKMETRGWVETDWHEVEGEGLILRTKQMSDNKGVRGRGERGLRRVGRRGREGGG